MSDGVGIRCTFVYFKVKKLSIALDAVCDAAFVDSRHTTLLLVGIHCNTDGLSACFHALCAVFAFINFFPVLKYE